MIARTWSAKTTAVLAPVYAEHLRSQVLPALRNVEGYAGALLLERPIPEGVEILVITFWRSLDSLRGFAGPDLDQAVVAAQAAAVLTEFDQRVRHYEVVVEEDA
jgi:heme-degrading monooxygenase HmoA